jgi:predicted ribosome quality control (RQC) complex YloA/Tae2 family protein
LLDLSLALVVGYCRIRDEVRGVQFDGLTMRACLAVLRRAALGGRLQRITQLTPLSLGFEIYAGNALDLVLSAETEAACLFVAGARLKASLEPSPFCSTLRRYLVGSRLVGVEQQGWDRVASLAFQGRDELGDQRTWTLVLETMGKHSNIICVREDGRILDAAKRIGRTRSRARQVLPGLPYVLPPGQDKLAPDDASAAHLLPLVQLGAELLGGRRLAQALTGAVSGYGPARAAATAAAALAGAGGNAGELAAALAGAILSAAAAAQEPGLGAGLAAGCEVACVETSFRSFLDRPLQEGNGNGAPKGSSDASGERLLLLRAVETAGQRAQRRLRAAEEQLAATPPPEQARTQADLIFTHLLDLRQSRAAAAAQNLPEFAVRLPAVPDGSTDAGLSGPDLMLSLPTAVDPATAATQLYERYSEQKRTRETLEQLVCEGRQHAEHLAALAYQLTQDLTADELAEVRSEAAAAGLMAPRDRAAARRPRRGPVVGAGGRSRPRRYAAPSGREVLAGRNNRQNEALLRMGRPGDIWLHARGVAGAHVLLRMAEASGQATPSDDDLRFAAGIAAYFSGASGGATVSVDWCYLAQVRKIKGAPPGVVSYSGERTLHVTPAAPAADPA